MLYQLIFFNFHFASFLRITPVGITVNIVKCRFLMCFFFNFNFSLIYLAIININFIYDIQFSKSCRQFPINFINLFMLVIIYNISFIFFSHFLSYKCDFCSMCMLTKKRVRMLCTGELYARNLLVIFSPFFGFVRLSLDPSMRGLSSSCPLVRERHKSNARVYPLSLGIPSGIQDRSAFVSRCVFGAGNVLIVPLNIRGSAEVVGALSRGYIKSRCDRTKKHVESSSA